MNHYFRTLLILLLITFSFGVKAQLNYKNGYIITLSNDTIFGRINDGGEIMNSRVCLFKADKKSKSIKYYPKDIKSYRFIGDKIYSSKELFYKGVFKYVFTDVLLEGEMNLYYDRKNSDMAYYLERKGGDMIGLINQEIPFRGQSQIGHIYYGSYVSGLVLNVYKDSLLSIFKDSKKIQNQVSNVGYNSKALINITKSYLAETCVGMDCISYEKDLSPSRESFGVFTGIQYSSITFWESTIKDLSRASTVRESGVKSDFILSVPVGIFYNFPLKLINDRLSFQIEFLTNTLNYKEGSIKLSNPDSAIVVNSRYIGFPLLFKYEISRKKISPSLAFGKETSIVIASQERMIHKSQKGGWFYQAGLDYKLGPKFSLFTNLRFQSNYTLMIADDGNNNRLTYNTAVDKKYFDHRFKTFYTTLYFGVKF